MRNSHFVNSGRLKLVGVEFTPPPNVAITAKVSASEVTKVSKKVEQEKNLADIRKKKLARPNPAQPQPQPQLKKPTARASKAQVESLFSQGVESAVFATKGEKPNGRPSRYKDEFVDLMFDFFNKEVYREVESDVIDSHGVACKATKSVLNTFPTFSRFASKIGVTRETLHKWATEKNKDGTLRKPEFSYTYTRAKDFQEALLIEGGLSGAYNIDFVFRLSQCLLGWKFKQKSQLDETIVGTTPEDLERIYLEGIKAAMDRATIRARNSAKQKVE